MAVRIRLTRCGRKKQPKYRIVVIESTNPRDGKTIEILGNYFPLEKENKGQNLKVDRINHWLKMGALPSERVATIFGEMDILPKQVKTPVSPGVSKKQKKEALAKK